MGNKTCSCRKWELDLIPLLFRHMMGLCILLEINLSGKYLRTLEKLLLWSLMKKRQRQADQRSAELNLLIVILNTLRFIG
ncbi:Zinc finger, PMZ-type [Trema orientale]|uniref:Zinc finger, PMZ-type n=1 Tax=Trema orientale TaxID=63057 RepID=A0A2P5AI48_TREOI|nr:Zinc finger, PMZ-type [Trema orientale]